MTDLVVPFDLNPFATEVKTGSYTIVAGEYAKITALCRNGGTLLIDAVTAVKSQANINATNVDTTTGGATYTVPSDRFFEGWVGLGGSATSVTTAAGLSVGNSTQITLGPGTVLTAGGGGGPFVSISGTLRSYSFERDQANTAEFWVPTGTAITITGDTTYIVQRYKIVT